MKLKKRTITSRKLLKEYLQIMRFNNTYFEKLSKKI